MKRPATRTTLTIATVIAAATTWQLFAIATASPQWITANLTVDDTYLALEVARRWADAGFPTFDGLHRTNGFHPAWGLVLTGLAGCIDDPVTLLRATLALVAGLNALTALLIAALCRRGDGRSRALTLAAVACWCAYCVSGRPALIGLENALLPPLIVAGLHLIQAIRRAPGSIVAWSLLALVGVAVVWTRLDAAVFVLFGVIACLLPPESVRAFEPASPLFAPRHGATLRRRFAAMGLAAVILVAGGCGYIAFERWAAGTNTPISGQVKRALASRVEPFQTPRSIADAIAAGVNVSLKHTALGAGWGRPSGLSSAGRILLIALLIAVAVARKPLLRPGVALGGIAILLHAMLIRFMLSGYFHDALWYYSATNVLAAMGVPVCLLTLARARKWRRRVVLLAVAGFTGQLGYSMWLLGQPPPPAVPGPVRIEAGRWLRDHVPPEDRIAAWNAGELAYFSGSTVINLDGLVNDRDFFAEIVKGRGSIAAYLDQQRVDWVIDYRRTMSVEPGFYWGVLPRARWREVRQFGADPGAAQVLIRRIEP